MLPLPPIKPISASVASVAACLDIGCHAKRRGRRQRRRRSIADDIGPVLYQFLVKSVGSAGVGWVDREALVTLSR